MKHVLKSPLFKYVFLPLGLAWGGLKYAYTGPEGYENPKMDKGIGITENIPSLEDEQGFIDSNRHVTTILNEREVLNITQQLKLLNSLDSLDHAIVNEIRAEHTDWPSSYFETFLKKENRDNIYAYFTQNDPTYSFHGKTVKMTLKREDLQNLQDFSDSVAQVHHKDPMDLKIQFEEDGVYDPDYNQAAIGSNQNGIQGITIFSGSFKNHSVPRLRYSIAHEWGHNLLGHTKTPAKNNAEAQEREDGADSVGIDITQDPHTAIGTQGIEAKQNGVSTLLEEFLLDMQITVFKASDHPTPLHRARNIQRLSQKMKK